METDCLGPYPYETIYRQEYNCHACRIEHGFSADIIFALNDPVEINPQGLSSYSDDEEVGKNKAVEGLNFVLESGHNNYGGIYGIAQEEVDCILSLRKLKVNERRKLTNKID